MLKNSARLFAAAGRRAENGVYNRQYRFDQQDLIHYL